MRVYNFSAGPSMLPLEVLEQAQADFVDYQGCGMSVTEMSHRSKQFDAIHNECISLIRELRKNRSRKSEDEAQTSGEQA